MVLPVNQFVLRYLCVKERKEHCAYIFLFLMEMRVAKLMCGIIVAHSHPQRINYHGICLSHSREVSKHSFFHGSIPPTEYFFLSLLSGRMTQPYAGPQFCLFFVIPARQKNRIINNGLFARCSLNTTAVASLFVSNLRMIWQLKALTGVCMSSPKRIKPELMATGIQIKLPTFFPSWNWGLWNTRTLFFFSYGPEIGSSLNVEQEWLFVIAPLCMQTPCKWMGSPSWLAIWPPGRSLFFAISSGHPEKEENKRLSLNAVSARDIPHASPLAKSVK